MTPPFRHSDSYHSVPWFMSSLSSLSPTIYFLIIQNLVVASDINVSSSLALPSPLHTSSRNHSPPNTLGMVPTSEDSQLSLYMTIQDASGEDEIEQSAVKSERVEKPDTCHKSQTKSLNIKIFYEADDEAENAPSNSQLSCKRSMSIKLRKMLKYARFTCGVNTLSTRVPVEYSVQTF